MKQVPDVSVTMQLLRQSTEGRLPALLSAGSSALVMALVLLMVTTRLSSEEQGYFFTFLSFAALAQLADFGLAYAGMQTASHLQADKGRMAELKHQALRNSLLSCVIAFPLIEFAGFFTLSRGIVGNAPEASWYLPWLLYVPAVLANLPIAARLAIHEGSGSIGPVWRLRAHQEWITGGILLAGLLGGAGLWSLVFSAGARPLIGGAWIGMTDSKTITAKTAGDRAHPDLVWRTDVWPFQWKIGLSFLCGFLIFRAITPVVLFERGEIIAGQIGLAISIMNMLISFSAAWPTSQAARFGSLLAEQNYGLLRAEFRHALLWSTAMCAGVIISALVGLQLLTWILPSIISRLPSLLVTSIILSAALFHHVVACFAAPLRAERKEPLLMISVVGSILTIILLWLAARYGGSLAIAVTNLFLSAAGIPFALHYFRKRIDVWDNA